MGESQSPNVAPALSPSDVLLRGETVLASLADSMPDGVFVKDLQGCYLLMNPTACRMVGKARDDVLGRDDRALFPPADAAALMAADAAIIASGETRTIEEQLTLAGVPTDILVTKGPVRDAAGKVIGLFGIARDITERKRMERALRESEGKFRSVFDQSPVGKSITKLTGEVFVNETFCRILGYTQDELRNVRFQDLTHPADVALSENQIRTLLAKEQEVSHFVKRYLRKDGRIVWGDISITVRRDAAGEPLDFLTSVVDITERVTAEAALRESEDTFRYFFDHSAVGMSITQNDGHVRINQAACDLIGRTEAEARKGRWQDWTHPDDVAITQQTLADVAAAPGATARITKRYIRPDGSIVWADVTTSARRNASGDVLFFLTSLYDITDRVRAEEALRANEYFLRESQRVAKIGSYRADFVKGTFICSAVLDEIFGIQQPAEHPIADWIAIIHPDDRQRMTRYLQDEVLGRGERFDAEYRIVRLNDQATRWVHGLGELQKRGGVVQSMTGTIQDITERRVAEAERDAMQSQLQQAQKMESVGRLAGGVAHDFNNMLGVIIGNVDMAIEQVAEGDPLREDLEEARRAAVRSVELTRQLLAFARKQTATPQVIDLNAMVAGTMRMLQRLIGEDIAIEWKPAAGLWPVKIDPSQVDQILANLCVNSRDAIAGTGVLTIETAHRTFGDEELATRPDVTAGDYVMLAVSDSGSGMDADTQAHLFEPFFTTKAMGKGTGLGLATVWGIVKQNGGFIDVTSVLGEGTTFCIFLPRHVGKATQDAADAPAPAAERGHETILVAEDEPGILALTARMLERQGYRVLRATTPGEAIRLAAEHSGDIHMLMTDVVMPEMNGRDLAKQLLGMYPNMKRLFMSGYTADVIAHRGVLDSGVHFLQKPFTHDALTRKVREALDDDYVD